MTLLLEMWREAGRRVDLTEFVARVAPSIARAIPLEFLLVRRVELERLRVETVARWTASPTKLIPGGRTACSAENANEVLRWCRSGNLLNGRSGDKPVLLELLAPADLASSVIAGPLAGENEQGVLLLGGIDRKLFGTKGEAHLRELLEPFSAALENDRRFHELARLREATEADNRALLSRLARHDITESIVGAERGLKDVLARVEKVAATDAPVLILGETGSGKEVIARAIHSRSPRAKGPIVRVNCGAIPSELVDSELFGHEKGSFTGAVGLHRGWFERADGGTLFLDEIGELPSAAQVRLLRILQDGSFERVGGQRSLTVDVRLVAATHRNLEDMVAQGTFRQDLWYRISVFPIRLPPLRERPSDIPELAMHFARSAGKRLGGVPIIPSPADLALLLGYAWPGNVRELASVIERAAILGDGRRLHLAAALGTTSLRVRAPGEAPRSALPQQPSASTLEEVAKRHIQDALVAAKGRIEGPHGAAVVLGINPHTLRARMRKLGIDWKTYRPERS